MTEYSVVGKRIPRIDAADKVTGRAVFSGDIKLPGMLHGKVLRSPYPHARILRLNVTKARQLEGVAAVITAADLPPQFQQDNPSKIPYLAVKKAVFAGQPIATVAAENPDTAEEALRIIEIEYEKLPDVMDVLDAMKTDAPLIHPRTDSNPLITAPDSTGNTALSLEFKRGDIETGFKEAAVILKNTFRTQRVHHGYLETRSCAVDIDSNGKFTVWTDNQSIFVVRDMVAALLEVPQSCVKVMPVEVGGAFGGKGSHPISPLCALLAKKTGRPVRMVMSRAEDLTASFPAPASVITLKIGATREGKLTAVSATLIYDCGAYLGEMPASVAGSLTGLSLYRIPNLHVRCYDVLTNKTHMGFLRGPSATQSAFAVESQMDLLARALKIDPIELRLKNAVEEGDPMLNNFPLPKIGFKPVLERMAQYLAQHVKPEGENRGRGIACGFWRGGVGASSAHVNINADGSVALIVGSTDLTGSRTSLAQMAAEEFGISFNQVSVVLGDTSTAPHSDITAGSRTMHQMGKAVCLACQDAKEQLVKRAAKHMNLQTQDLEFSRGRVQEKGNPDKSISLAELARITVSKPGEGPVTGRGAVGYPPPVPMFAVQAADVEVDRETGKVKVLAYAAAQDVGLAVNPMLVEGQIQGAVAQGIGWALYEDYVFEKGIMQNANLLDYRMPTAADLPYIEPIIVECASSSGPFGVRGVGEPPIVPSLAAIANAVHSATGVRVKELPMTPEAMFHALHDPDRLGE